MQIRSERLLDTVFNRTNFNNTKVPQKSLGAKQEQEHEGTSENDQQRQTSRRD